MTGKMDLLIKVLGDLDRATPADMAKDRVRQALPLLIDLSATEYEDFQTWAAENTPLEKPWLAALRREVREARAKARRTATVPVPDLEALMQVRRLHPAIDFPPGYCALGFRVDMPEGGEALLLLLSDGREVTAHLNPQEVTLGEERWAVAPGQPPRLLDRWALARVRDFLTDPAPPKDLFQEVKTALATYIDLPGPALGLLGVWAVATYFAHLFACFPYLHLYGPKETGKSKTLQALSLLACNPYIGRDISGPALGDTCEAQRGTMLLDQAEKLSENSNLIGLLADGYKRAGGRRRVVELSNNGRQVLEFATFSPKCFASTKPLDADLSDRCVPINMTRTLRRLPDLEGSETTWLDLRDKIYRFALLRFPAVAQAYQETQGDGRRITELWRPMAAVLKALEVPDHEISDIQSLFLAGAQENRHEPTPWEATLLQALAERAQAADALFELTAEDILDLMAIEGEHTPGRRWVGGTVSLYSLAKTKRRRWQSGKLSTIYTFDPAHVTRIAKIYLGGGAENECSKCISSESETISVPYDIHLSNGLTCREVLGCANPGPDAPPNTSIHVRGNEKCKQKVPDIIDENTELTLIHFDSGDPPKKKFFEQVPKRVPEVVE